MKTEMLMERKLFGGNVRQKHKTEMLSASDLLMSYNKMIVSETGDLSKVKKINKYFELAGTVDFLETLEEEFGADTKLHIKNKEHWVHPFVFLDIALWVNPKFKIEVYKWLHDGLLANRDISGNSYNKMSGIVFRHYKPFTKAKEELRAIAVAIQNACSVSNSSKKKWEVATEDQLSLRNKIQDYICLLYPIMGSDAIDHAISKAKEDVHEQK